MADPAELYARLDFGDGTEHFVGAFEQAETLLADHGLMTYADLIYRPLLALEADATLRARVQGFSITSSSMNIRTSTSPSSACWPSWRAARRR